MKIRLRWWPQFKKLNLTTKIFVILTLLCTFCGNTPILGYVTNMMLIMVLVMCSTCVFKRLGREVVVNRTNRILVGLLGAFATFLIFQSRFSFDKGLTLIYARRYCVYTIFLILLTHVKVYDIIISLFKGYSWIAGLSGLLMTILTGKKSGGLLGDYQAVGMMMSIACIIFVIDYFENRKNFVNMIGYLLSLTCVFVSGKRTFSLLAILCLVGMYLITSDRHKTQKAAKIAVVLGVSLLILYNVFPPIRELVTRTVQLNAGGDEFTRTSGRSGMWKVAMSIFLSHKLFGTGFATFAVYTGSFYRSELWAGKYLTHNIYYGLISETGLVGTLILVSFFFYALIWSCVEYLKYRKQLDSTSVRVSLYAIFVQIWFVIYGYSGNGIYDANEFFFYIMAIAMMIAVVQESKNLTC